MEVVCKCGYRGSEFVEYETQTPTKQIVDYNYGYKTVRSTVFGTKTINWACPKCKRVLVRQLGGFSYRHSEEESMRRRLQENSYKNERWLKASKLLAGEYKAKLVSIRKKKDHYTLTLKLENDVEVKEMI